jgi:TPR repeat protein
MKQRVRADRAIDRPRRRQRHGGAADASFDRFRRASESWERGEHRRAFRMFLHGARAGDPSAQLNLGHFYDEGIGVRANVEKALFWYRRAYQAGSGHAAGNIGLMLREQRDFAGAIRWLKKALTRGDDDSALHLAEIQATRGHVRDALQFLARVLRSSNVTPHSKTKARALQRSLERESTGSTSKSEQRR